MKMANLLIAKKFDAQRLVWACFFVIFIPLFVSSYRHSIPAEDAVILYEYAKNLAQQGTITYGGSSIPVEGATDFAWMVVIAALKWLGIDEFASALILNFLGLILIASLFKGTQQKLCLGAAVLLTPYLYASLNGFSAILFSALYLLSLKLLIEQSRYLYFSLFILCLVRPDGVVWSAGCVLTRLLGTPDRINLEKEIVHCALWLIFPGLIYFLWRCWYFQELLPLPFIVKATSKRDFFLFYKYSIKSVLLVLAPLFFTLVAFSRNKKDWLYFLILFGLPAIFYSAMRLEQNIGNRFMAPFFFASLFLISKKYNPKALLLLILISFATQLKMTIATASGVANSKQETVYSLSKDLKDFNGRMLVTEAGRLTYYSNWFSEDSWGLNTPRYAHKLITKSGIEIGKYDLIVAHCDLSMLNMESNLDHDQSRTWSNQCKTIVSYIRESQFDIYLVPFLNDRSSGKYGLGIELINSDRKNITPQNCKRHDIYAVSRQYEQSGELINMLKKHGAKLYDQRISTVRNSVCDQ